jgi:cyanophycin synthetase
VAELAPLSDGAVVLYAQDASLPVVVAHRANGSGRAVLVKNGRVVLATGNAEHVLGTLTELTFGRNAVVPDTDALLAAIGAAWALDIAPDLIGAGIKTFEPELPARAGLTS